MKFIALLACLVSLNSFAATKIQKTFDGGAAKCLEGADVGSRAYNLEVISEKIVGDKRQVVLNVLFYKCAEVVSGYGLRSSSSDEILHSFIILKNGDVGQTNNKLVSLSFAAIDSDGKLQSEDNVKENGGKFIVNLSIDKDVKKVSILSTSVTDITSDIGNLSGVVNRGGGYILSFN